MTYVFEKITDEIREKIFSDVKRDCIKKKIPEGKNTIHKSIEATLNESYTKISTNWAVDHDKDYYLVRVYGRTAPDRCYLFYYKEECYELIGNPRYAPGLYVVGVKLGEMEQDFFDQVDAAFLVYGNIGTGNEPPMISISEKHLPIIKRR